MSDLWSDRSDQPPPPTARIATTIAPRADLPQRLRDLAIVCAVMVSACVPVAKSVQPIAPAPEFWVDGSAPGGGDGTQAHPWKSLPSPVPSGAHVHLATGLYQGPFTFSSAVRLEGHGQVVLTSNAGETTLTGPELELESLDVQGGDVGVSAVQADLRHVHFSGQRREAFRVQGLARVSNSTFVASVEGITGIAFGAHAHLDLDDVTFEGGFKRAVSCEEGGTFSLHHFRTKGVKAGLHAVGCQGLLEDAHLEAGSGPGVFTSSTTLAIDGLHVRGQEEALQLGKGSKVAALNLDVEGTQNACVTTMQARLELTGAKLTRCGLGGALMLLESESTLDALEVHDTPELGLFVHHGSASVANSTFVNVRAVGDALGDAIQVRDAKVSVEHVSARDVSGSGLFVSAFSEVTVGGLEVERAKQAALFVERGSHVTVKAMLVRGGNGAVLVPDEARVTLESLSVAGGSEMPIYAECDARAQVEVTRLESTVPQLPSRCVKRGK